MQKIRTLRAVVVGALVAVAAVVGPKVIPSPTPGASPVTVIATLKPATTKPTTKVVHRYDNPAKYIVGHHQAGAPFPSVEAARRFFKGRGYAEIAYTVLITRDGKVWKGRAEEYISGANKGLNAHSVSFCWLGNIDAYPPTDAQFVAAGLWVQGALKRHVGAKLIGHGDVAGLVKMPEVGTSCPGKYGKPALKVVWYIACGFSLPEAKRRAGWRHS